MAKNFPAFEKYLLPGFLFVFQTIFIILYGLLVRYDDTGAPHTNATRAKTISDLDSSASTLKVYPCKYVRMNSFAELSVDGMVG